MRMIAKFPYEGRFFREVNILNLKDSDFPYPVGDDYLRDKNGEIYTSRVTDIPPSAPPSERILNIDSLVSNCDVTESSAYSGAAVLGSKYTVSLPAQSNINLLRGDIFEADVNGFRVNGEVLAIFPSQLGLKIYISDTDN